MLHRAHVSPTRSTGRARIGALVALLALASAASAQGLPLRFTRTSVAEGLPSTNVNAVVQDRQGFVWIGTDAGLARTDGVATTVFRSEPGRAETLPQDLVSALLVDRAGRLWVGTDGGLARFDARSGTFVTVLRDRISALFQDRAGALWAGTRDGAVRLEGSHGRRYRHVPAATSQDDRDPDWVVSFAEDARGGLWVGTRRGLDRLDAAAGRLVAVPLRTAAGEELREDDVQALVGDAAGVWIGSGRRLLRLDPATRTVRAVPLTDLWPAGRLGPNDLNVRALWQTPQALWVGTDRGLVRLDLRTGARTLSIASIDRPDGLLNDDVRALIVDRQGVLWVGTRNGTARADLARGDLTHVAPSAGGLASPMVFALLQDRRGAVWVGTDEGLFRHDRRAGTFTRTVGQPGSHSGLGPGGIRSLLEDADGTLWIGTIGGVLNRLDPATGVVRRYDGDGRDAYDPRFSFRVRALLQDRAGTVWAGVESGLYRIDRGATVPRRVARIYPDRAEQGNEVWALVQDAEGVLWAGCEAGLLRFDPRTGETRRYLHSDADPQSVPEGTIYALHLDAQGALWLGTMRRGLARFDRRTGRVTRTYTASASGLPDNTVYAIQAGASGELWLSTNLGLARLSVASGQFEAYGPARGAQSTEFNAGASFRSPQGELFFGGVNGYNSFFPGRIRENATPPQTALTGLRVMNRRIGPSPRGPLRAEIGVAREVVVRHDQNFLTFEFAGLHAAQPAASTYAYRLDGLDDDWQQAGLRRTASYTDLDVGTYTFRVRSRSAGGVWSAGAATIRVRVVPFWYETVWARVLAALALLGGLGLAVVVRLRRAARREHALETTVAERTLQLNTQADVLRSQAEQLQALDHAKSAFLANLSHELRTPLTLMLGPLDALREGRADDPAASADLALRNGQRLLRLVNQLLDIARLEAGRMPFAPDPGDLAATLDGVAGAFSGRAAERGARYAVDLGGGPVWARYDADAVEKVAANLLSNAFKFVPAGGLVRLHLHAEAADGGAVAVRMTVANDGPAIPAAELPHLFERFYHGADESGARGRAGTGIGLSLVKELVELHGGRVSVASDAASGTVFTVVLTLDAASATSVPARPALDPVLASDPVSQPAPVATGDAGDAEDRTTVLVAEDHPEIRALVRACLAPHYRVLEAADGAAALALVRTRLPDLVVADVMMPDLDGVGLVDAIRADPATDFVPVVLLTADATMEGRLRGLGAGADDYLTKPFEPSELLARVANLLRQRARLRVRFAAPTGDGATGDGATGDGATGDGAAARPVLALALPDVVSDDERFLETVRQAVATRLADEAFGVEAFAAAVGVSRRHLLRRLKETTGETPAELLRRVRLEHAAALLDGGVGTVSEAAYAVGFKSVAHFSRVFGEQYGMPPSAYATSAAGR